jgi:hypothetical protein
MYDAVTFWSLACPTAKDKALSTMTRRIIYSTSVAAVLCFATAEAQLLPVGFLPTYHNGGFAGEAGAPRISTFSYYNHGDFGGFANRYSWTRKGSLVTADHFFKKMRSGIALTAGQEKDTESTTDSYKNSMISLAFSPKFSSRGKYTLAPFVDVSVVRTKYIAFEEVHYYGSPFPPGSYHWNELGVRTGFLVNSDKAYAGISAEIFDYNSSPFENTHYRFLSEIKYLLQTGYTFQRKPESRFSFTPQLLLGYERYRIETIGEWHRQIIIDLNLVFRYGKFIAGLNRAGFMAGYQNSKVKIQLSGILNRRFNAYTGSVGLRYVLRKDQNVKTPGF